MSTNFNYETSDHALLKKLKSQKFDNKKVHECLVKVKTLEPSLEKQQAEKVIYENIQSFVLYLLNKNYKFISLTRRDDLYEIVTMISATIYVNLLKNFDIERKNVLTYIWRSTQWEVASMIRHTGMYSGAFSEAEELSGDGLAKRNYKLKNESIKLKGQKATLPYGDWEEIVSFEIQERNYMDDFELREHLMDQKKELYEILETMERKCPVDFLEDHVIPLIEDAYKQYEIQRMRKHPFVATGTPTRERTQAALIEELIRDRQDEINRTFRKMGLKSKFSFSKIEKVYIRETISALIEKQKEKNEQQQTT